jgi:hypothetical protein
MTDSLSRLVVSLSVVNLGSVDRDSHCKIQSLEKGHSKLEHLLNVVPQLNMKGPSVLPPTFIAKIRAQSE